MPDSIGGPVPTARVGGDERISQVSAIGKRRERGGKPDPQPSPRRRKPSDDEDADSSVGRRLDVDA